MQKISSKNVVKQKTVTNTLSKEIEKEKTLKNNLLQNILLLEEPYQNYVIETIPKLEMELNIYVENQDGEQDQNEVEKKRLTQRFEKMESPQINLLKIHKLKFEEIEKCYFLINKKR
jgi:hydroxymethylpyrimidine pyrophosphatase-like HAD family hydrolase